MIGRANDDKGSRGAGTMTIDEFEFWSRRMSENEIRETGIVIITSINFVIIVIILTVFTNVP